MNFLTAIQRDDDDDDENFAGKICKYGKKGTQKKKINTRNVNSHK